MTDRCKLLVLTIMGFVAVPEFWQTQHQRGPSLLFTGVASHSEGTSEPYRCARLCPLKSKMPGQDGQSGQRVRSSMTLAFTGPAVSKLLPVHSICSCGCSLRNLNPAIIHATDNQHSVESLILSLTLAVSRLRTSPISNVKEGVDQEPTASDMAQQPGGTPPGIALRCVDT